LEPTGYELEVQAADVSAIEVQVRSRLNQFQGASAPEGTASILVPEVVTAPDDSNPSLHEVTLEPSLEPQVELEPAIGSPKLKYNPPRPAPKGRFAPEASTAVIVNYLEDSDDNFLEAQGRAGQLAEEDDLDIDLMDMRSHEPIRLEARPMVPAPKVPL
jgi:hypothetical protein